MQGYIENNYNFVPIQLKIKAFNFLIWMITKDKIFDVQQADIS